MIRKLLFGVVELLVAIGSYIAARWLLEVSTVDEDWQEVRSWWYSLPELRWYRGQEFFHQLRGRRILWQVFQVQ